MNRDRRIVIIGFMGCGKTTVAEALAERLGCAKLDLDSFITDREGHTPAEIIVQDSEPSFREIETRALKAVLEEHAARVIALGGGAWTIEANRALMAQHDCLSVWLDAPFEVCWERILISATVRPLAPDRESARMRYDSRRADYGTARLRLTTSNKLPDDLATEIQEFLSQQTIDE
jgi:shikimate kinase